MAVTMICPNLKCGRTVVAAESARGKVVRCAHCQILFLVPRDAKSAAEGKPSEPQQPVEDTKRRGRR
jgi:hypothetical protein